MQDTLTNARPDDCACWSPTQDIPCWECYRHGHTTPNPEVEAQ